METTNVKVVLRIRPLSSKERLEGSSEVIHVLPSTTQVVLNEHSFTYDAVYDESSTQQEMYSEVQNLVSRFVDGYNGTILAYGQTGSGKTFTMGTGIDGCLDSATQGIIFRSINDIFELIAVKNREYDAISDPNEKPSYSLYLSFIEIYNEEIIDLLSSHDYDRKFPLAIREDSNGEIYLSGVKEEPVRSIQDIYGFLRKGTLCRSTGSTDMNVVSSRSHAIFTVMLKQRSQDPETKNWRNVLSKLHFVDLAGSERVHNFIYFQLKRTNAVGARAKESISINSGLLALGNVISALGDTSKKATHIPYRDSKLTRLLQDSLGGNSQTAMIACVSPAESNCAETLSTLRYSNRARNIRNRLSINQENDGNQTFEIIQLKKQISSLKQEILMMRGLAPAIKGSEIANEKEFKGLLDEKTKLEAENEAIKAVLKSNNLIKDSDRNPFEKSSRMIVNEKDFMKMQELYPVLKDLLGQVNRLKLQASSIRSNTGNDLLNRAKNEICQNLESLQSRRANDNEEFEEEIGKDLELKQELVSTIERMQREYSIMQEKYENQLRLLQSSLSVAQKERESALKNVPLKDDLSKVSRSKYEEKIKKLGKEIEECKVKLVESERSSKTKILNYENIVRNLKNANTLLKNDKSKSVSKMTEDFSKLKTAAILNANEIKELKQKERKATELAKKWKKGYELQKTILQKKTEQFMYAKSKLRTLVGVIRKRKLSSQIGSPLMSRSLGNLLDSPNMWKIVAGTPNNEKEIEKLTLNETEAKSSAENDIDFSLDEDAICTPTKRKAVSAGTEPPFEYYSNPEPEKNQKPRSFSEDHLIGRSPLDYMESTPLARSISRDLFAKLSESGETTFILPNSQKRRDSNSNILHRFSMDNMAAKKKPASEVQEFRGLQCKSILSGHSGAIYSAISNGTNLISASQDGSIRLWDLASSTQQIVLQGQGGFSKCLALINENLLVSSSQNSIKLWDLRSSKVIRQFSNQAEEIQCLHYSADRLYSGAADNVSVWDMRGKNELLQGTLSGHRGAVFSIATNESMIFTGSRDHLVKIWNQKTLECSATLKPPHYDVVTSLLLMDENGLLFSGSRDASIKKWQLNNENSCELLNTIPNAHKDWIKCFERLGEGLLCSASKDGNLRVWHMSEETHKMLFEKSIHDSSVNSLHYDERNGILLSAGHDRLIKVWKV